MKRGRKSTGVKEIAEKLNISPSTVSVVLNGQGRELRISRDTQDRVWSAAEEYGFCRREGVLPGRAGRVYASRAVVTIFMPYMTDIKVASRILYGFQKAIVEGGLDVKVVMQTFLVGELYRYADEISSHVCDGAIILGMEESDLSFLRENDFDIPVLLFNRVTEKYSTVYVDDYEVGNKVARLFKARGHKNVGLVLPVQRGKSGNMRKLGFLDGCRECGLDMNPLYICEDILHVNGGKNAVDELIARCERAGVCLPTAMFVFITEMTVGVMHELALNGIRVPENMEIVSYGDNFMEEQMLPSVTAVKMEVEEMGKKCLETVMQLIQSGAREPSVSLFPTPLIVRMSCGGFPE